MQSVNFLELAGDGKVPVVLVGTWFAMALLLGFGYVARRSLASASDPTIPDEGITLRSFAEAIIEWLDGFVHDVLEGHDTRSYVPFFGSLFLFILTANLLGLIPGLEPPTGDSDLTFALGITCFFYYLYQGARAKGVLRYLKTFLGPVLFLSPLMVLIEIADNLFRPFSLGVRLAANMFADHTMLGIFTNMTKLVFPVAFYALGMIVCAVQALVFLILALSYVRMAESGGH